MPRYIVTDPEINARQGVVWAQNRLEAVNSVTQEMGWGDCAEFRRASRGMGGLPRRLTARVITVKVERKPVVQTRELELVG